MPTCTNHLASRMNQSKGLANTCMTTPAYCSGVVAPDTWGPPGPRAIGLLLEAGGTWPTRKNRTPVSVAVLCIWMTQVNLDLH